MAPSATAAITEGHHRSTSKGAAPAARRARLAVLVTLTAELAREREIEKDRVKDVARGEGEDVAERGSCKA